MRTLAWVIWGRGEEGKVLWRMIQEWSESEESKVKMRTEAETREMCFGAGGRGHKPKNTGIT